MNYHINPNIRTLEDLGVAHLGSPHDAIVPPKRRIDRAEYGRRLAETEGGVFTPSGYFVPIKNREGKNYVYLSFAHFSARKIVQCQKALHLLGFYNKPLDILPYIQ